MTDIRDSAEYDDTPLSGEELEEHYYLDRKRLVGIRTEDPRYVHKTNIEDVMPDDFLYRPNGDLLGTDDFTWNITYQFTSDVRYANWYGNLYGNPNMTYRRLYVILCEHFLHGVYFIHVYFTTCYRERIQDYVEGLLYEAKSFYLRLAEEAATQTRVTKSGKLDKRYKVNKMLKEMGDESFQSAAEEAERAVKEDIIICLQTGIIPLDFSLSERTLKKRAELGIDGVEPFYATGQLIHDLVLFFRLEKKEWQTETGIMV